MNWLLSLSRAIDAVNFRIGKAVAWLVVLAVLISAGNAVVRKLFSMSSNTWLELQWILFSAVFLLCASWTLIANEHIRVDVVNNALPKRVRNWIDLVGHVLFLLPFAAVMTYTAWPFFERSWRINEQSSNAGGLPQWPAKFLIPLAFALLFLQGLSEIIKRVAVMRGMIDDPHAGRESSAEAEAKVLIAAMDQHSRPDRGQN